MNVIKPRDVKVAIRTLDKPDQRKALAWIDSLANWDKDATTRKLTRPNPYVEGVYELNTPDDLMIFFRLDPQAKEITLVDIIKPSRFPIRRTASE